MCFTKKCRPCYIFKQYVAQNVNIDGTFYSQNYQCVGAETGSFVNGSQSPECQSDQPKDGLTWSVQLRVFLRTKTILELWQGNMNKTVIALTLTDLNPWL